MWCRFSFVAVLVWLPAVLTLETMYEWSSIDYEWASDQVKQQAVDSGAYTPSKIRLGTIKEHDGVVYVGTPRSEQGGVPATLSAVVDKPDGTHVLKPFPNWDAAAQTSIRTFDIDRKGRVYAIEQTDAGDVLSIYSLKTTKLLRRQPLPKDEGQVSALVVDDHGRSHTHITDTLASTVFMLAGSAGSGGSPGSQASLLVYTYQHSGDIIKAFSVPASFDKGTDTAALGMAVSGNGDTVYLNSPHQIWSFQTNGPKRGSEMRVYPVTGEASKTELQGIGYHPSSRQLVFCTQANMYKVNPLEAWSKSLDEQKIALTDQAVLSQVTSICLDWKYDFLAASQSVEWKPDQMNHKIYVLSSLELLAHEQAAQREAMDFSDL